MKILIVEATADELSANKRIADAIIDGAWEVVGDKIDTEVPKMISGMLPDWIDNTIVDWAGDIGTDVAHYFKDEDVFKDALSDFLKSDENKDYVISLLNSLKNEDYIKAYGNIKTLIDNFEDSFEVNYEDIGTENFEIFGYEIEYTNIGSEFVNGIIKDEVLNILKGLEKQIDSYAAGAVKDYIDDAGGIGGVLGGLIK